MAWGTPSTTRFVYHGWNLLTEYSVSGSTLTLQRKNTWGLDLGSVGVLAGFDYGGPASGRSALDAAGGIGGLLATLDTQGTTTTTDDKKYVYFYDANGNVGQAVDTVTTTSVTIAARYEYDAYGVNVLDTANLAQSGPYAAKNPFRFSTKWFDDETTLGYWGYRYYLPSLGRFLNRDPASEPGSLPLPRSVIAHSLVLRASLGSQSRRHLYHYARNSPPSLFDVLGLLTPSEFWDDWTQFQRDEWFKQFWSTFGPEITKSSSRHCIPEELLAAVVANEQIDYSQSEAFFEALGFGSSIGPAQITIATAESSNCLPLPIVMGLYVSYETEGHEELIRSALMSRVGNLEVAGCLVAKYLRRLCHEARGNAFSKSFSTSISDRCCVLEFCCQIPGDCSSPDCEAIRRLNVPSCVIRAMAAVWNNGPSVARIDDVPAKCPNAVIHADNAGLLDDQVFPE